MKCMLYVMYTTQVNRGIDFKLYTFFKIDILSTNHTLGLDVLTITFIYSSIH